MKKTFWIIVAVIIIILAIIFSVQKGPDNKGSIKIGFTGPFTGEMASFGENAKAAVQIAVEEVNAEGGINGRPLEVVYEDDACNGAKGVSAAQKLINIDKVPVAVSGLCSMVVLSSATLYEKAHVVDLAYSATSPAISNAGDYIFRNIPSDNFQAKKAADYIYNTLGKKKLAVVYVNNDWGTGLNGALSDSFKALGGTVVVDEAYEPTSKDLRSQFSKVKDSDAEALYFAGFPDGSIVGIKQIKDLKINLPIVGADAWDSPKLWKDLNGAGDGAVFFAAKTSSTDGFKAKMKQKVGSDEIMYPSNYAYDDIKYIAEVMRKVGTDGQKIKDELYKTTFHGTVSQPVLKFDKNGDPEDAVYALKKIVGTEMVEAK